MSFYCSKLKGRSNRRPWPLMAMEVELEREGLRKRVHTVKT